MLNEFALTEIELAQRWAVSIRTLQRWCWERRGPRYIKLSRAVRYWVGNPQERQRLGIPFYALGDTQVIRPSIEEVFRWEIAHLVPRALPLPSASWPARTTDNALALT